jgi:hypothetical protein
LQQFTFCHSIDNGSPWEDIIRKKVSKLRSIAELRVFNDLCLLMLRCSSGVVIKNHDSISDQQELLVLPKSWKEDTDTVRRKDYVKLKKKLRLFLKETGTKFLKEYSTVTIHSRKEYLVNVA